MENDFHPQIGDIVCDCKYQHQKITHIYPNDLDLAILADGSHCSIEHCLAPVDHAESHPEELIPDLRH